MRVARRLSRVSKMMRRVWGEKSRQERRMYKRVEMAETKKEAGREEIFLSLVQVAY